MLNKLPRLIEANLQLYYVSPKKITVPYFTRQRSYITLRYCIYTTKPLERAACNTTNEK
jgi:hypothetical protein